MATANYYVKSKVEEVVVTLAPQTTLTANYYATKVLYVNGTTVNALEPAQYAALDSTRWTIETSPF